MQCLQQSLKNFCIVLRSCITIVFFGFVYREYGKYAGEYATDNSAYQARK